jgi:lysophospholipase L1-like esterase
MKEFDKKGWEWREVSTPSVTVQYGRFTALQQLFPFLIAGLLWLGGKLLFAAIVAALGLGLLLLRFSAPPAYEAFLTLFSALGKRLGKAISYTALTIVYGLVFTPVAGMARLLRRDGLELEWQPSASTYWVDVSQLDPIRFFAKPFLVETRQGKTDTHSVKIWRLGRALYHSILTLFVLNLALGYLYSKVRDTPKDQLDPRSQLSVYVNDNWANDYFKEFDQSNMKQYTPFIGWTRKDYTGRYINIKDGHRQTYRPSMNSKPVLRLYIFGGSFTWGTGGRDDYTIASYLVKLAGQEGMYVEAENYAESAFVNWQSVIRFAELCAEGKVPDIAIFVEGVNDVGAKLQTPYLKRVHANFPEWREWVEQHDDPRKWFEKNSLLHKVARRLGYGLEERRARETILSTEPERVQRLAHEIVTTYQENAAFVRKLAEAYGFKAWFFWQPMVSTKKHPTAVERTYVDDFGNAMTDVYRAATQEIRSHGFAIDLSTSFDDQDRTIYIDQAHITEVGNEIIAKNIYGHIQPALQALTRIRASEGANQ